jgi:hypothetical protein
LILESIGIFRETSDEEDPLLDIFVGIIFILCEKFYSALWALNAYGTINPAIDIISDIFTIWLYFAAGKQKPALIGLIIFCLSNRIYVGMQRTVTGISIFTIKSALCYSSSSRHVPIWKQLFPLIIPGGIFIGSLLASFRISAALYGFATEIVIDVMSIFAPLWIIGTSANALFLFAKIRIDDNTDTADKERQEHREKITKLGEAWFESLPQLVLQICVAVTTDAYHSPSQYLILAVSCMSCSFAMISSAWNVVSDRKSLLDAVRIIEDDGEEDSL